MSLSDIMSDAGLAGFAEAGLVIFLFAFVAILLWTMSKSRNAEWVHARQLPLDDDELSIPTAPRTIRGEKS